MTSETDTNTIKPVRVSGNALRDMTKHVRVWSGWDNARLTFGPTDERVSPYATTSHVERQITANVDRLLLNPHRVLNTVNPFRLRQEAVLTGVLLHEAGHARYSLWQPRTIEAAKALRHGDGTAPKMATLAFARLIEEPRVEGRMVMDAGINSITGLEWTMRASAAALLPPTDLSEDAASQMMEVIESWVLRAGRQVALVNADDNHVMPDWANDFSELLHQTLIDYLASMGVEHPVNDAMVVMNRLRALIRSGDDTGTTLLDGAREVLDLLFPETDNPPTPSSGCCGVGEAGEPGESSPEPGEQGEGGTSADAGSPESDEQGESGEEDPSGESGAESGENEGEPETGSGDGDEDSESDSDLSGGIDDEIAASQKTILASALKAAEFKSDKAAEVEAKSAPKADDKPAKGISSGNSGVTVGGTWRTPTPDERETQRNAEKFLRDLINPSESSRRHLSETPSATVDGAALAAWRAAGERTDPMFFIRARRESQPTPPIKIAILVDVSGSMDEMQAPSSLLSWALASAAYDLRNFAGRGRQIECTLIHWGDEARVIQPNGVMLPGLRDVPCVEYTNAMGDALALVEQQIPGFFDVAEQPENRLLVQFTDWGLGKKDDVPPLLSRAMEAGVNMMSVVPQGRWNKSTLDLMLYRCPIKRGRNDVVTYNPLFPEAIWAEAAKVLAP